MSEPIKINYVSHGGNHQVAIVLCPKICRRFLHLSKDIGTEDSWVLRDHIGGRQIDRNKHLNAEELSNIEAQVLLSLDENRVLNETYYDATWRKYLLQLSDAFISCPDPADAPPRKFEKYWEPIK